MKLGQHKEAIADYDETIRLKPQFAAAYFNRGISWLHFKGWDKAKADLTTAKDKNLDIVSLFRARYKNVANFEQQHQVQLPKNIADMLGG